MAKSYDQLDSNFKSNIANAYVKPPFHVGAYNIYRGMTDFTNIGQFTQYEKGYGQIFVLSTPKFMDMLAEKNPNIAIINEEFKNILEYEFKGIDGLPDITSDKVEITNGAQTISMISNVTRESAISVTMQYYERTGLPLTKYSELFLTGIKDPNTKYKTYHGLIDCGLLEPSYANEIFKMLYINTDNTGTAVEGAVLLTNMQLTQAKKSIINATRGEISNETIDLEFSCYPVYGELVDKMAAKLLRASTGVNVKYDISNKKTKRSVDDNATMRMKKGKKSTDKNATIDTIRNSNGYEYSALTSTSTYGCNVDLL